MLYTLVTTGILCVSIWQANISRVSLNSIQRASADEIRPILWLANVKNTPRFCQPLLAIMGPLLGMLHTQTLEGEPLSTSKFSGASDFSPVTTELMLPTAWDLTLSLQSPRLNRIFSGRTLRSDIVTTNSI